MSDLIYVNTRLRAMNARLLPAAAMKDLAQSASLPQFLNTLGRTGYQSMLAAARARLPDQVALDNALHHTLTSTVEHIQAFCRRAALPPATNQLLALIWTRYDIHNVIAIQRGLRQRLPPATIMNAVTGGGRLPLAALRTLAEGPSARAARDLLVTWDDPLAAPLLALGEKSHSLPAVEVALAQWYFEQQTAPGNPDLLRQLARREADKANIMTLLRRLATGAERPPRAEWPHIFLGPGTLTWSRLADLHQLPDVTAAVDALHETRAGRSLSPQPANPEGQRLSHFARQLQQSFLAWLRRVRLGDPFGPGILLAYLAHKENELGNLRRIGAGLWLGETSSAIAAELVLV